MAAERSCEPGVRTLRHRDEWISKSHAICPFDFAEYNRRLARILEKPEGGYSPEYFSGLFGSQPMVQRPRMATQRILLGAISLAASPCK